MYVYTVYRYGLGDHGLLMAIFDSQEGGQRYVQEWWSTYLPMYGDPERQLRWLEAAGIVWTVTEATPRCSSYMWQVQRRRVES